MTDLRKVLWIGGGTGGKKSSTPQPGAARDDQWSNRTPREMVEGEVAEFAERVEMVLEDLAALPAGRLIADGFRLLPELIAPVAAGRRQAIFLLPTPAFRDWALARRGWIAREGTSNPVRCRVRNDRR